ncbi:MAG TPA: hypothetical protein VIW72_01400 [Burkholderiales bacterium]
MREDILRRVNKLLASFMPMQVAANPSKKYQKKAQSQGLRFNSTKGGGWRRQHVNAQQKAFDAYTLSFYLGIFTSFFVQRNQTFQKNLYFHL